MSAHISDHEGMVTSKLWRWGTQVISLMSVLTVNTALTSPQRPLRAFLRASMPLSRRGAPETLKRLSVAVFRVLVPGSISPVSDPADHLREG